MEVYSIIYTFVERRGKHTGYWTSTCITLINQYGNAATVVVVGVVAVVARRSHVLSGSKGTPHWVIISKSEEPLHSHAIVAEKTPAVSLLPSRLSLSHSLTHSSSFSRTVSLTHPLSHDD